MANNEQGPALVEIIEEARTKALAQPLGETAIESHIILGYN